MNLTGTPKQITWADDIRSKAVNILSSGRGAALLGLVERQGEASWWIEHRFLLEDQRNIVATLLKASGYMDRDGKPTEAGKLWMAEQK